MLGILRVYRIQRRADFFIAFKNDWEVLSCTNILDSGKYLTCAREKSYCIRFFESSGSDLWCTFWLNWVHFDNLTGVTLPEKVITFPLFDAFCLAPFQQLVCATVVNAIDFYAKIVNLSHRHVFVDLKALNFGCEACDASWIATFSIVDAYANLFLQLSSQSVRHSLARLLSCLMLLLFHALDLN